MKDHPTAWAWKCEFGLCQWAEPSKEQLEANKKNKPSPEAKAICVRLVPNNEYRALKGKPK